MSDRKPIPLAVMNERRLVLLAVGALGVSCVMTQLALLRELLGAFSGNELVLGVVLGNWLLLMGLGTWVGRTSDKPKNPLAVRVVVQLLVAGAMGFRIGHKLLLAIAGALAVAVTAAAVLVDLDGVSTALQYPRQHIVARANSPYGKLLVTESDGQFDFIENGIPLTSTRDDQHVEETVHYAMAQRPEARRVLLVSGGISGTAREILKYGVRQVDYVELDPLILEFGKRYLPENLADPRIRVINTDGRLFVKQTSAQYDVVIIDILAPATAQLNRFYTTEFLAGVKRALVRDGVVCFALGQYENYVSPELARMLSSACLSVKQSFHNVLMIPGQELSGVEPVELRSGRREDIDDDNIVLRRGLLHEQAPVGVDDPDARVGQVLRQVSLAELQDQGVQLHVVNLAHTILEDLPGGAGDAAGNQQHPAGFRPLRHCVVHGLLHVLVIAGGGDGDAVLNEIELAVGLGHDEFAIGRIGPRDDVLPWILQACGEAIRVGQQGHGDQTKTEGQSEGGKPQEGELRTLNLEP